MQEQTYFTYKNNIDKIELEFLLKKIKTKLDIKIKNPGLKRRIYSSIIEILENIVNHNDIKTLKKHPICLKIYQKNEKIIVEVANTIPEKSIKKIDNKYNLIKNKNKDEIKQIFKQQIKMTLPENDSAGLGIFQIARATNNNLKISFQKIDDNFYNYFLKLTF
jgi:hypothetical protein